MIMGAAADLTKTQKPFFIVLQCFGGGEGWQRSPTGAEMRVMAYLALIHGALGLQYFARSPADVFPSNPSAWNEVRKVALEVAELSQAIAGGGAPSTTVNDNISGNTTWIKGCDYTQPCQNYAARFLRGWLTNAALHGRRPPNQGWRTPS